MLPQCREFFGILFLLSVSHLGSRIVTEKNSLDQRLLSRLLSGYLLYVGTARSTLEHAPIPQARRLASRTASPEPLARASPESCDLRRICAASRTLYEIPIEPRADDNGRFPAQRVAAIAERAAWMLL